MPKTAQQGNAARQLIRIAACADGFREPAEGREEKVCRMTKVNPRSGGLSREGGFGVVS